LDVRKHLFRRDVVSAGIVHYVQTFDGPAVQREINRAAGFLDAGGLGKQKMHFVGPRGNREGAVEEARASLEE
jgi:hypothetical protein